MYYPEETASKWTREDEAYDRLRALTGVQGSVFYYPTIGDLLPCMFQQGQLYKDSIVIIGGGENPIDGNINISSYLFAYPGPSDINVTASVVVSDQSVINLTQRMLSEQDKKEILEHKQTLAAAGQRIWDARAYMTNHVIRGRVRTAPQDTANAFFIPTE